MAEQYAGLHSCSSLAGLLGDPLTATATEARAWLLVEHPGPWGKNALDDSGIAPELVAAIKNQMDATGVRVQLISPPENEPASSCFAAVDPIPGSPLLAEFRIDGLPAVLDLDFAALAEGRVPAGAETTAEPLYVVCANDRSDPCCGRTGPGVFAAVKERVGSRARRTAHVGGHKYASNMVAFPYAVFYGRLDQCTALDVVTAHDQGLLYLDRYRGRSAYLLAEQAAEHFLRVEAGFGALRDVWLTGRTRDLGDDRYTCSFAAEAGSYEVVVRSRRREPARLQSCSDPKPTRPMEWRLETIRCEPATALAQV